MTDISTFDFGALMLLLMLLAHFADDFHFQGILADMKQRRWWEEQFRKHGEDMPAKYSRDYLCALAVHSLEWSIAVMLAPVALGMWRHMGVVVTLVLFNAISHAYVDDMKANRREINLVEDQSIHLVQIACMWLCCLANLRLA